MTKDFWGINILYEGGIRDHGRVIGGVLHWCSDIVQEDILALSLAEQLESLLNCVVGATVDALNKQGVYLRDRNKLEEYVKKNRYICIYRGKRYFYMNQKSCWARVECVQSSISAEIFLRISSGDSEISRKIAETRPNPFIFQAYMADIQWQDRNQAALNVPGVGEFLISCDEDNISPL